MPIPGFANDEQLIGYCELHCETQRALFNGVQIREMYRLAGIEPLDIQDRDWWSMHWEMKKLCEKARDKKKKGS